jgi:hypothetical protein
LETKEPELGANHPVAPVLSVIVVPMVVVLLEDRSPLVMMPAPVIPVSVAISHVDLDSGLLRDDNWLVDNERRSGKRRCRQKSKTK